MRFRLFGWLLAVTIEHPRRVGWVLGVAIFVLLMVTNWLIDGSWWLGAIPAAAVLLSLVAGSLSTWSDLFSAQIQRSGEHPDLLRFQFATWLRQQREKDDEDEQDD